MAIFQNIHWNLGKATFDNGKEGIRMEIVMKRKIISEVMTTYFPTLLLTAITFATLSSSLSSLRQLQFEPDNHAGDDDNLHQQDGVPAPHLEHQDDQHLACPLPDLDCFANCRGVEQGGQEEEEKY